MRMSKVVSISILMLVVFASLAFADDRVGLGFLYGSTESIDLVERTNGAINQVSPTCFDLDDKGNLYVTSNLTHKFVDEMHSRNVKVMPFLSNHWARQKGRKAVKNAEKLSDQIVNKINEYDLDGVNIDIENLTSDDRDNLSEFVRILSEKMPEGKVLSVSVAANPTAKDYDWQGSYDYQKLGEYSDYIFVMTYDEHSIGSPEGPVASNEFMKASIEYALQYVPKEKIVAGIPFFGRYWKENEVDGGQAVVIGAVPSLLSKHKGIIEYNEGIGETRATITINSEEMIGRINGNELEDGKYFIWYQSNDDIKSKLKIINDYDLLGCGVWALGQEKAEVWKYFKDELNKGVVEVAPVELVENEIVTEQNEYLAIKEEYDKEIERILESNKIKLYQKYLATEELMEDELEETMEEPHLIEEDNKELVQFRKELDKNRKIDSKKKRLKLNIKKVFNRYHVYRMEKVY